MLSFGYLFESNSQDKNKQLKGLKKIIIIKKKEEDPIDPDPELIDKKVIIDKGNCNRS